MAKKKRRHYYHNQIDLDPRAVALRPVRALKDGFRYYEATTFKGDPWAGCHVYLRRLAIFGFLAVVITFVVALAVAAAMAVLAGAVCGVGASIPTSILIVWATRHRRV